MEIKKSNANITDQINSIEIGVKRNNKEIENHEDEIQYLKFKLYRDKKIYEIKLTRI